MILRSLTAFAFAAILLVSQTGVPLIRHYCQGALENISLFIHQSCCEKEITVAPTQSCCKIQMAAKCQPQSDPCCKDEVVLVQENEEGLSPIEIKWNDRVFVIALTLFNIQESTDEKQVSLFTSQVTDTGPPLFLKYTSLIYYA